MDVIMEDAAQPRAFGAVVDEMLSWRPPPEHLCYNQAGLEYVRYDVHPSQPIDPPISFRIYTGVTRASGAISMAAIERYRRIVGDAPATVGMLKFSTLTLTGEFTNLSFDETRDFDLLRPRDNRIIKLKCNFGEYQHPASAVTLVEREHQHSTRRLQTQKMHHKRRMAGNGRSFGSQITFYVWSNLNAKIYKIKVFRNGKFQIPGIQQYDMKDVIQPLVVLCRAFREEFADETIGIAYVMPVMINFTSQILQAAGESVSINLNACEECMRCDKQVELAMRQSLPLLSGNIIRVLALYADIEYAGISEIQNNPERYFGTVIRFRRPMPWNNEKRSTLKILKVLKISFDGVNSLLECIELHCWFTWFFTRHRQRVIYRIGASADADADADSSDENESIYDSDPELVE